MIKLLVHHGADVDARCEVGSCKGWTPLCLAARFCNADAAQALICAGAGVHTTSANGKTALDIAEINAKVRKDRSQPVLDVLLHEVVASVLEISFAAAGRRG